MTNSNKCNRSCPLLVEALDHVLFVAGGTVERSYVVSIDVLLCLFTQLLQIICEILKTFMWAFTIQQLTYVFVNTAYSNK